MGLIVCLKDADACSSGQSIVQAPGRHALTIDPAKTAKHDAKGAGDDEPGLPTAIRKCLWVVGTRRQGDRFDILSLGMAEDLGHDVDILLG